MEMENSLKLQLQSSDGVIFKVDVDIARYSGTINAILDKLDLEDKIADLIPLPKVDSTILKMVIDWATHDRDEPTPPQHGYYKGADAYKISAWDAEFLKVDMATLLQLLSAATYMDMRGLYDVIYNTISNMTRGKTIEEIFQLLPTVNVSTPAEQEEVGGENAWAPHPTNWSMSIENSLTPAEEEEGGRENARTVHAED
ncbi:unnamed protein product [Orchesella dallaii]|uniref:S-phase kinase-associated protein 1 n=1 Tax=Orchesella dallaii TaxID=48710 RepID=A0ABP1RXB8_9HEXA